MVTLTLTLSERGQGPKCLLKDYLDLCLGGAFENEGNTEWRLSENRKIAKPDPGFGFFKSWNRIYEAGVGVKRKVKRASLWSPSPIGRRQQRSHSQVQLIDDLS